MPASIRIALRRLVKTPGFTVTALATLALCIGANLAIFSVVDAILVRSLPFPKAEQLVTMYFVYPKLPSATPGASLTNYFERRGKLPALSSLAAISEDSTVVGESGSTTIEKLGRVTPEFFKTLGVAPFMGRAFNESELTYQTDHEAMITYEIWKAQFASDPNVLGKSIRTDGIERVIVGVLPPGFRFLSFDAPIYSPLSSEEGERNVGARHAIGKILVGRMAAGAALAEVQAQVEARDAVLAPEFPDAKIIADSGCHTVVAPLHADYVASVRPTLLLLQAAALLLLLIGCVNLVNLMLIRANNRAKEMALRRALGAGVRAVIADVATETLLLTAAGAVLGLWAGAVGIRLLGALGVDQLPLGAGVAFNGRIAAAALFGSLGVGACVALPIAWFNLGSKLAPALSAGSRGGTAGTAALRLRRAFIVAQIALAFVLLTGAGLLGMSLLRAMAVAPGFRPDHVITGRFNLTWKGYPELRAFRRFFDRLSDQTRGLPGISFVGATTSIPVVGAAEGDAMTVKGYTPPPGGASIVVHDEIGVAGDYFQAMGIPLISGRFLRPDDAYGDDPVCVVDETFARLYWPGGDAVGKQIYQGTGPGPDEKWTTIVGVVGTVKQADLTEKQGRGAAYLPYSQRYFRNYVLVARTVLTPEGVANVLGRAVRAADPDVPLTDLRTMDVRVSESLSTRRSPALMAGIFAAAALLLATVGLYGVMAYAVAQRTREFGIRIALGARAADVLRMVFVEGVRLAGIGLALGLALSVILTRYMASLLFGVGAADPLALAGVGLVLSVVATAACLLPARRATTVDPMVALRAE